MRRSPRSRLLWGAAVAVAIVTAVVVFQDIAALHRRARSLGPPRDVLVVAANVPLGATLSATDVRVTSRHASTVPKDALGDVADAVGRTVAVPLVRGAIVQDAELIAAERDGLEGLVPVGHRAVRVQADDGLAVRAGAVVDVLAAWDPSLAPRAEAEIVARAALVLGQEEAPDDGSVGVTLLVTEAEARGLAYAAANGIVTLALAPPEDACCSSPGS